MMTENTAPTTPSPALEGAAQAASPAVDAAAPGSDGYAKVEGLDRKSLEHLRMLEARAAEKTASDYVHIVWSYGILWAIFAAYGLWLWRKARALRADAEALERRVEALRR